MAGTKKILRQANRKEIEGHPGLSTFVNVSRDPGKEKALLAKISRNAIKLRDQTYIARAFERAADERLSERPRPGSLCPALQPLHQFRDVLEQIAHDAVVGHVEWPGAGWL
jgi:hypothetical protein